eukprot:UN02022
MEIDAFHARLEAVQRRKEAKDNEIAQLYKEDYEYGVQQAEERLTQLRLFRKQKLETQKKKHENNLENIKNTKHEQRLEESMTNTKCI